MGTLVFVVVLLVIAAFAFGVSLASRSKRTYARQNEIVPGQRSKAPASWAGAHTPEAKLHRRLRDAVAAVRANAAVDQFSSARTAFGSEALALDEKLVAVAALPASVRAEPLAKVETAVAALESAAAALALQQLDRDRDPAALNQAITDVDDRMRALAEARAEVEYL